MTGLEKILAEIRDEAAKEASEVTAKAEAEARQIMDEATAEVARASGVKVDVVGTSPTVTALVDALEDSFSA